MSEAAVIGAACCRSGGFKLGRCEVVADLVAAAPERPLETLGRIVDDGADVEGEVFFCWLSHESVTSEPGVLFCLPDLGMSKMGKVAHLELLADFLRSCWRVVGVHSHSIHATPSQSTPISRQRSDVDFHRSADPKSLSKHSHTDDDRASRPEWWFNSSTYR